MDKQSKDSECVQVFVRVRPEDTESPNGEFAVTIFEGNKSLRLSPPDGTYNSRKSVTAVDDKTFTFDHVFDEHCSQEQVYAKVAQHAKAVIGGYNTTIFAYGSTGSGKSHTMTGTSAQPGIIPRVVSEIFSIIEKTTALENDTLFYVRISYVELYNNNFRNLLEVASKELGFLDKEEQKGKANRRSSTGSMNEGQREEFNAATSRNNHHHAASNSQKIEVRESQSAGVFLSGHNLRIPITSAQEAFQLISKGNKLRHTGSTNCNDVSSRSHAILTIHVESRVSRLSSSSSSVNTLNTSMNRSYENLTTLTDDVTIGSPASSMCTSSELRLGKMHLVDLAGSERLAMSGAEGEALVETQNINLSLTALGDVLSALSRNATVHQQARANSNGNTHHSVKQMRNSLNSSVSGLQPLVPVPYRNSKLTHLLKDSLGGNSKTIMITNIRSLSVYYQQTYISLLYASRAKKIQNRTVVNRNVIGDTGIHAVTGEIERLKHRLDERTLEFDRLRLLHQKEHSENSSLKAKLMELSNANNSEKIQLENQLSQIIHSQAGQLETQKKKILNLQDHLQQELVVSQNTIAEQDREIKWLKSALEENSADVQAESKEQLTRMQRVVDAWQSQANTSQQELVATMQKMEELRNKVNKLTTEVHNLQDSNNSLSEELTERNQEIAVHTAKEKSLQNELDVKSKVLKNVHEQQSAIENELKQLKTKNNSSASLAQEMTEKNKHLAEELNALRLKCESMENSYKTQFSELKNKQMATNSDLSNKLSNMEQKSSIAIQNYAQKLSDSEAALSQAEKYNAACTSELNELKSKFAEIQNKTENVIRQKDMVVKGLHATNKQNQLEFDELKEKNKENEIQIQKLVNNTSDLKNQLLEKDKELLAKSELFLNQLEKRANEFKATQLKHKAALELLKEQHEAQLNEVSAKNGIQMALKIDELKLLANKQESEVSRECQEKHSDEIAKLKLEHDASLKAVEETLRLKMEEKLSKLRASMAEAHAIELDTLRQDLMLTNSSDIHTKITQVEHQYSNLINEAQSKVEVMQQEHQLEISNLKSAHSTEISVLQSENNKEKEHALNGLIEKHNQALLEQTNEFQKQSKQTEEEHRSAIEALQQKHAASLKKAISTTKSKIEDFYKKKIEDTNSKHEDAYRELQSALMDTQSKLQDELQIALQSQENNLKQQSSEQVHELKQELINQQQKHSDSLYALEARHAEALGSATRTLRESLLQEHEVECTMLKKRHEEELENALNALRLELEKSHQTRQNELRSELQQQYNSEKNLLKENAAVELSHAVESAKQLVELEVQSKTEAQTHEMLQKYRLDSEDRHRKQIERAVEAAEMEFKRNQDIVLDELTTKLNQEWQLRIDENNARWKSLNQQNLDANKVHLTMKFQQEQTDALEAQKSVLLAQGDAMVAEVKAEMKQLVGKYEDQIASLKTEHSLHLERECSSLTLKHTLDLETCLKDRDFKEQEAHGLEMETLREELTTSFENQLQRKNDELSSLKNKMDSLITEQQVAMEELRVQLQLKYQEAVQTHANAQDNVVSNLNEEHESEIQELRNKHDDYVESLMLKHDKISRELRNEIKTVREISSQLEETLKDTRAKHAIELERLHEDYAVKANDLSNGKTIEMKEQLQNLADTHNMELTKMSLVLEKAESRHLSQIAQLESNYKNNLEKQTNDMKSTHENALVELRDELSHQYKTSLNAYQVEAQNEKSKLLQEKEECEMKYLKIIEVKKHEIIDLENNVTSLTHQMETNQLEWNEKFNVAMKKNELQLSKELKSQQIDYENQLNLLNLKIEKNKQLHQEECLNIKKKTANAIEKNNQEIIENLKCRHEEELKQANEKYEKRTKENKELIQKLKSELNTMEEKLHHKSKEFENLLEENDKKHSIKILELQDKHANVIRNMMAEFDTTLEKTITSQDINYNNTIHELQKQAKDALELHQYELKECTKQCEMDLNQCRLSYEEDLKQLRERLLHANTMANDKERLHAHEIDELKHEYASNLALARQQQREEIKQLGEQTRADHEKELAAANEQLKQAMDQQIASEKSKVLKDFEYQLKQKEFAFEQFTEETERQKTALEDRIKLNELTHENEISKIQLDCDSKVTQWKAMNHQLELTIQQNQQQIKDAQDDMDHMKQQHRFQINDMTRTYDSQLQSLKSQHAEAIHKLTAEKDELIKNHTELDSSQKQQIVELKQQNSMKTTENIHLTNSIQSNNALISQMKVDIDQLSEDIVTLNKHTKEKEEEFQNVILPKCLQEERTAVETPLLLKIKELEQTTANTSLDKNKTYSELVDVTNKLNHNEIEMKKLLDRLKKTEEQHVVNINQALARQHEDMKVGYLGLIQQQVETLMQVIVQHSNKMQQEQEKLQAKKGFSMLPPKKGQQLAEANKHMEDVYQQFLDVVKTLPDAWKEEYGTFPVDLKDNTKLRMDTSTHSKLHTNASNEQSNVNPAFNAMRWHIDSLNSMKPNNYSSSSANSTATLSPGPKTPIKVLMKAEEHRDQWVLDRQGDHSGSSNRRSIINNNTPSGTNSSTNEDESNTTTTKENIFYKSNKNMSNISSGNVNTGSVNDPTLSRIRTSPTDQLVSAVLDGDVAGIRAVVKSHGNNSLKSEFWRNITRSILPLHRAISGLHFHGSETLLVNCLDTLLSLGADISELDHSGNTVIHKAIQVCTSKSIVAVIQLLIKKGCNVNVRNREGSMAIHCECKRVRTASARVINLLVKGGADVNAPNRDALQCTPLSLVLLKGVASIAATNNNEQSNATYPTSESVFGSSIGNDPVVDENPWDRSFHSNPDDMNPDEQAEEEGIAMASTYRSRRSNVMNTDKQRVSGRHVWIQAALVLVQSGANWSHQLRLTPEKSSQLHLLFAAFPPAPADVSAYCSLIQSAFKHGLSPCNMEDINKRNALFILCDRMRNVPIESCPDAAKIMKIVIEACNAQPFNNIGSSDRYGVTIFDLSDGTGLESTCFSVCKPLIVENLNATGHNKSKTSNSDALLNKSHVGFGSSFRRSHV